MLRRWFFGLFALLGVLASATVAAHEPPPTPTPPIEPTPCEVGCREPFDSGAKLERLEIELSITDGATATRYRLHFRNGGEWTAEGRAVIPVPNHSSVTGLTLSGGPETLEGKLLDAGEAERIYEEIVRRRVDPALLKSLGDDLYEARVFPVPPGEERVVSFTVTSSTQLEGDQAVLEVPWSRMSPRPAAATLRAEVDVSWEVRSLLSPGLAVDSQRQGPGRLTLSWESPSDWAAASDFRLYLTGGEGLLATRLLAYRAGEEDGYFALLFAPVVELDRSPERDVILVLDTSGSMEGEKIAQARGAARYVLEHLRPSDRFNVVAFSDQVRRFAEAMQPAARADEGIEFVEALPAQGSTNIAAALRQSLSLASGERPATVIFLTDGLPTIGIQKGEALLQLAEELGPGRVQLFAFGVGYDVDTVLLDSLAARFVGTSHYVTPEEQIDVEVAALFERVSTPVLTDVTIEISGGDTHDLAPARIPGLFAGSTAVLTGRYRRPETMVVTVRGNSADGEQTFTYHVTLPDRQTADATIAQLWAQRRVADLISELRVEGGREGLIEEIVAIATQFGIVTPYTAYLAEEPELALTPAEAARSVRASATPAATATSGPAAVEAASDVEELRDSALQLGGEAVQVVGDRSFILVDGGWIESGYDFESEAGEVMVGSEEFAELLRAMPEIAGAAALGERVIVRGPEGWLTIVWLEPGSVEEIAPLPALSGEGLTEEGPRTSLPTVENRPLATPSTLGQPAAPTEVGGTVDRGLPAWLWSVLAVAGAGALVLGGLIARKYVVRST